MLSCQPTYFLGDPKMTDTHIAKIAAYIDLQNASSFPKYANYLLDFVKSLGLVISIKVYYSSLCPDQVSAINSLKPPSFQCVDVPCPLKDSADNRLMAHYLKDIQSNSSPDIVILISGDGDFVELVQNAQDLGKKVIILAQKGVKQKLKEIADEFHFLDELSSLVAGNTESKIDSAPCKLTYTEAVECLVETIKTCLNQGKRAGLGFINRQMCKLFPNYEGVTSICKHDGKSFSRFSKFVKAVEKDGIIRMENQELFLI
jgi:NYN domain